MSHTPPSEHERRIPARVLIIEATEHVARHCLDILKQVDRLDLVRVISEAAAFEKMNSWHPQLLIVGDAVAGISGQELCSKIRLTSTIPMIFLTKHTDALHQIQCLNTGADDCIAFPFEAPIYVGRILCLLRRSYRYSRPPHPDAPRGIPQFQQRG